MTIDLETRTAAALRAYAATVVPDRPPLAELLARPSAPLGATPVRTSAPRWLAVAAAIVAAVGIGAAVALAGRGGGTDEPPASEAPAPPTAPAVVTSSPSASSPVTSAATTETDGGAYFAPSTPPPGYQLLDAGAATTPGRRPSTAPAAVGSTLTYGDPAVPRAAITITAAPLGADGAELTATTAPGSTVTQIGEREVTLSPAANGFRTATWVQAGGLLAASGVVEESVLVDFVGTVEPISTAAFESLRVASSDRDAAIPARDEARFVDGIGVSLRAAFDLSPDTPVDPMSRATVCLEGDRVRCARALLSTSGGQLESFQVAVTVDGRLEYVVWLSSRHTLTRVTSLDGQQELPYEAASGGHGTFVRIPIDAEVTGFLVRYVTPSDPDAGESGTGSEVGGVPLFVDVRTP